MIIVTEKVYQFYLQLDIIILSNGELGLVVEKPCVSHQYSHRMTK